MAGNLRESVELESMELMESLRTELIEMETDVSTIKQFILSQAESDEIKRKHIQRFNEDETEIKVLISKFAAMKERLLRIETWTESETFKQKYEEMFKILNYSINLVAEKKKFFQTIKQLIEKQPIPNLQHQVLAQEK